MYIEDLERVQKDKVITDLLEKYVEKCKECTFRKA